MIGTKIEKPLQTAAEYAEYSQIAEWCNQNNARIEDKGEWYEVCEIPEEKTELHISIEERLSDIEARLSAIEERLNALDGDLR